MKKVIKNYIKKLISIFFELPTKEKTIEFNSFGSFSDSNGNSFSLLAGYRDHIMPRWRNMFSANAQTPQASLKILRRPESDVLEIDSYLKIHGTKIEDSKVLEIGCHGGLHAYSMAKLNAQSVIAIDIPQYGVVQNINKQLSNPDDILSESKKLENLRFSHASLFNEQVINKVTFKDLDIKDLEEKNKFDLVISWETLEHITEPEIAFKKIFEALRPGGFSFHEYNPFFSVVGGHSLCTLDFPYGHACLDTQDFSRYVKLLRPSEADVAERFLTKSLNRMTLKDLKEISINVGFEIKEILPWPNRTLVKQINPNLLRTIQNIYPKVKPIDLLSEFVWVLLYKPK